MDQELEARLTSGYRRMYLDHREHFEGYILLDPRTPFEAPRGVTVDGTRVQMFSMMTNEPLAAYLDGNEIAFEGSLMYAFRIPADFRNPGPAVAEAAAITAAAITAIEAYAAEAMFEEAAD